MSFVQFIVFLEKTVVHNDTVIAFDKQRRAHEVSISIECHVSCSARGGESDLSASKKSLTAFLFLVKGVIHQHAMKTLTLFTAYCSLADPKGNMATRPVRHPVRVCLARGVRWKMQSLKRRKESKNAANHHRSAGSFTTRATIARSSGLLLVLFPNRIEPNPFVEITVV